MSAAEPDDDGRTADSGRGAATFEEIVAGWRAEGAVPDWPDEHPPARPAVPEPTERPGAVELFEDEDEDKDDAADAGPDDHFVPPEPPPIPRLGQTALVGVALLVLGLGLLVAPGLLGLSGSTGLTLGLLALAGGLGWLVLRAWPSKPTGDGDGEDDGAVL